MGFAHRIVLTNAFDATLFYFFRFTQADNESYFLQGIPQRKKACYLPIVQYSLFLNFHVIPKVK